MRLRRRIAAPALCALASISAPSPMAGAQETPGYHPDTAAGREYQLPVQRTRREATGRPADPPRPGKPGGASGAKAFPLFGVGVGGDKGSERSDDGRSAPSGASAGPSSRGRGSGTTDGERAVGDRGQGAGAHASAARLEEDDDGSGPLELGFAGGILTVVLGAAVGLAVRIRSGGSRSSG